MKLKWKMLRFIKSSEFPLNNQNFKLPYRAAANGAAHTIRRLDLR
jgi:hypothetical protein